ncbi:BEN domain-containing protein 5-like [Dermacentor andersoni]|uniref:BEN domain-containing protein 5-like n=1 Tax=Dermacentor andersoni TaxID=34620 RepID=UPI003B3BDEA8
MGTTEAAASAASVQERVSQQLEPSNRPSGAADAEAFQPSVSQDVQNSTEQVLPDGLEPGPSQELEEALPSDLPEVFYSVIGSERDDGMLYAGSGKWLEKEAWDTLFRSPTDSLFCRMATNVFWTPKQQRSRSVTGTLSNKSRALGETKPRPALTPEKVASLKALFSIYMGSDVPKDTQSKRLKDVRRHLAQKLGDIRRK